MVGLAAGTITTLGFAFLSPLLEEKVGLGDTCGVHNLHGMPGLLGGLVRALPRRPMANPPKPSCTLQRTLRLTLLPTLHARH